MDNYLVSWFGCWLVGLVVGWLVGFIFGLVLILPMGFLMFPTKPTRASSIQTG